MIQIFKSKLDNFFDQDRFNVSFSLFILVAEGVVVTGQNIASIG